SIPDDGRVGGTKPIKVNLRLITTTNKDLEKSMAKGLFREDLYHRLNVVTIYLPPLRKRKEDIPLLANYFLRKYNRVNGRRRKTISAEALDLLVDYQWPGNVRELQNVIERAVVLTSNEVILSHDIFIRSGKRASDQKIISSSRPISLLEGEKPFIQKALKTTHWNQTEAARLLGIHRNTLGRKIKYFNVHQE
ncbi:sigma-54-dependent Fis family transcriptional regulator, partial [Candidatus Aerophobetes bacterium]